MRKFFDGDSPTLGIYVDLGGNAEGFVPRTDMIPREIVKSQDRIKALLKEVKSATETQRGPLLFLPRRRQPGS